MRLRGSVHITAVLLLILVSIAAAVLLYLWLTGRVSTRTPVMCRGVIHAVKYDGFGLRVWLQALNCNATMDGGYLVYPDGSLAARLVALKPRVKLGFGRIEEVYLYSLSLVKPGDYILKIPIGPDPVAHIHIPTVMPETRIFRNETLEELNGTLVATPAYNISVTVTVYQPQYDTYNVTVVLCANPGYEVTKVRFMLFNASLEPPMWIGPYYVFTEQRVPFTYPDCSIANYYPVYGGEQPLTLVVQAAWRRLG